MFRHRLLRQCILHGDIIVGMPKFVIGGRQSICGKPRIMNRIRFSNEDESYNLVVGQVFGKRPMNDSKHVVAGRLAIAISCRWSQLSVAAK